jgi:hypothetical protein
MRTRRFQLTEAAKLDLLADLAAAKGERELADDIRRAARLLVGGTPPDMSETAASANLFRRPPRTQTLK